MIKYKKLIKFCKFFSSLLVRLTVTDNRYVAYKPQGIKKKVISLKEIYYESDKQDFIEHNTALKDQSAHFSIFKADISLKQPGFKNKMAYEILLKFIADQENHEN